MSADLPEVGHEEPMLAGTDASTLLDLHDRLIQKRNLLLQMVVGSTGNERTRLAGKVEGVDLALSFIEEARRGA